MDNSKFVLGSKYDLRTKLILLIGANILIFLGFGLIYQSLISVYYILCNKCSIRTNFSLFQYKFSFEFNFIPLGNWEKIFAMYYCR